MNITIINKLMISVASVSCLGALCLNASVTQFLLESPPATNAILQDQVGGTELQVRGAAVSPGWRGASQTFQWNNTGMMTGIGVRLTSAQTDLWADQPYKIYVQSINPANGDSISVIADISFNLQGASIVDAADKWLIFEFNDPIALTNNEWYGFTISPTSTESTSTQRLRIATSADSDAYIGAGSQFGPAAGLPVNSYDVSEASWNDLAFVIIPEPRMYGVIIAIFALGLTVIMRRKK